MGVASERNTDNCVSVFVYLCVRLQVVSRAQVFARMAPDQKAVLVEELSTMDYITVPLFLDINSSIYVDVCVYSLCVC